MDTQRTEFFPGLSGEPGMTLCNGLELPDSVGLILPYSLVSVEPEQDRYSALSQLWRDADGEHWMINYLDAQCEWCAWNLGRDFKTAQTKLASVRAHEIRLRTPTAKRVLAASKGADREEIWRAVQRESDWIDREEVFWGSGGDEELLCDIHFTDGSWLRVLHPAGIQYKETKLAEAFSSRIY